MHNCLVGSEMCIRDRSNSTDTNATKIVTVITKTDHSLAKGTAVLISYVNASGNNGDEYDGTHVVAQVINDTTFTYSLSVTPATTALPNLTVSTQLLCLRVTQYHLLLLTYSTVLPDQYLV